MLVKDHGVGSGYRIIHLFLFNQLIVTVKF